MLLASSCTAKYFELTLIVSEEEDAQSCQAVDGDEERPLLEAVDHIPFRNLVHLDSVAVAS